MILCSKCDRLPGRVSRLTITQPDDVPPLLLLKAAAPHLGKDLDAMRETAAALKARSLDMFKQTLKDYNQRELSSSLQSVPSL